MSLPVDVTGESALRMQDNAPDYWRMFEEMKAYWVAVGSELDNAGGYVDSLLNQFFIPLATWGLQFWERELGEPTDLTKTYEERRAILIAKLRGVGTVTREMVERVAQAYERGKIEVINEAAPDGTFTVRFIDTLGTPPQIADLMAAIERIKPAHLEALYAYRYLRIKEIHQVMTLNQIQATRLSNFTPGESAG